MKCRACEKDIPDGSNYCVICGTRQTYSHCINCGNPVSHDAVYCKECGIRIYKPKHEDVVKRRKKQKLQNFVAWLLLIPVILVLIYLVQQF